MLYAMYVYVCMNGARTHLPSPFQSNTHITHAYTHTVGADAYQEDLQAPLLEATRAHYAAKAQAWLTTDDTPVYLLKARCVHTKYTHKRACMHGCTDRRTSHTLPLSHHTLSPPFPILTSTHPLHRPSAPWRRRRRACVPTCTGPRRAPCCRWWWRSSWASTSTRLSIGKNEDGDDVMD